MEDNIDVEENQILENNLENSSKKDLIDEIDSMRDEISSLKDENARTKSNLMWKVRKLEKDKVLIENEKIRLEREAKSLRAEVERFRSPPLVLATITEILDDNRMTVKSSTGPSFLVKYSKFLDEKLLVPGSRVALNQQTFGIVEILPSEKDKNVSGMEIETKPDVTYETIGGLEDQIVEVKETVELPLKEPELFEKIGIDPPKGILLYGPPGTGKTLLAKAVANETNATFIKIVASEFVKKYIGEGARLVREVFELAKEKAPAIIFIDELDAVAAKRLKSSTSGDREVQRTLMQLLAELDGFESRGDIGIIGATNRPDILDPALLRPGRFDRFIEVPLPNDEGRKEILKIHTEKMALDEEADLDVLSSLTEGLSGADLKAVCTEAGMFAIREKRDKVTVADFMDAVDKVVDSNQDNFPEEPGVMFG
ncbi:proteasome-activating nucleotidase [Methanobrevibacter woesei]|uniref:proteasome-activating nucleotidase n=1 Tax=Methanobrevibacter woesei TaxID=190976 RepID=UPI0023576972|nr:proteasome-activating nucleotidase [Methanobrevibacter woesei]